MLRIVIKYLALLVIYIGETPKYFIDLLKFLNIFKYFYFFLNCCCALKRSHYYFKWGSKSHICTECHAAEKIPCAGAAPCAISCAGISKRKPAPFFWNRPMSVTAVETGLHVVWKSGYIMLALPTGNTVISFQNPGSDALMRTLRDIFRIIPILQSPSWILWKKLGQ